MARFKVVSKFNENQSVWFVSSDQKITNGRAVGFQGNTNPCFYPRNPKVLVAVDNPMSKALKNQSLTDTHEIDECLCFTSERKLLQFLKRK